MARQSGGALLSGLESGRGGRIPYYRQLEDAIRRMILNGDISTGQQLPASRQLAKDLDLYSTPAFFINGLKAVGNRPYENFKKIIDKELGALSKE